MILQRCLTIALQEAQKSKCKHRLGCVAIANNQIVSKGFNRHYRSGVRTRRKGECTIHAECITLRRIGGNLVDSLLVARLTQGGMISMAMPCKRCIAHAKRVGIQYIYYTDWFSNIQKMKVV